MFLSFDFGLSSIRVRCGLVILFLAALLPRPAAAQSVFGTVGPRQVSYVGTVTWTASASGLDPATTRYAYFRRRPGGTWIPDINAPSWTSSTSFTWNPSLSDVGVWETYVWAKDGNTPPTQNTYGYAAGHNTQPIEVFGPPTVPGPTTASCAWSESGVCWVTGDFTASVSPSSGGLGSLSYEVCRSHDTTGWGGCDVSLTLNAGTSYTVSGSHLPADGYRRVYYFMARDSAGALSGWNTPLYVKVDRYEPNVGATNASDLWYSSRTATISASDSGSGLQEVRYSWNSAPNSYCTTGTPTSSGAVLTAPGGDNVLYVCGRDNTGRVGQWSGRYRVSPMSVTGSVSPSRGSYLGTFTSTATASGGNPSTTRFAFFRRRPGGTWIPAVTAPVWQSNTHTWQPALADVGTWETYIWVKDGDTPSNANTYGYAAGVNTGLIEVVGPPAAPGATTASCAWTASGECWVTGDFTASVTASTGGMAPLVYEICRSNDTTGFGGCDVSLTLNGGTSVLVSGTHLASDGYRRAYYFLARDSAGARSGWNTPLYVRVDRYAPAVGATNASDTEWFYSRTATVSASDPHSGVQAVRYAWNAALDAACTTGTATSSGAVLTAPSGDNTLYLCARDNTGRVAQWSGRYRVANSLGLACSISPARGSYAGTFTYTATATGGIPSTTRFAFFRRRPGGTWIPDINAPNWQAGNTFPWNPTQADVGMWDTYVWVKDGNTPATQNTYGYAAGCNSGPIEVVAPPTVPGPTTVACAHTAGEDCWVTGDFTASATASTGGMGGIVYQICRSNDTSGFGGCDVNLTLTGGTSILVSGTHLPSDAYRRAYYFQARDSGGGLSGWNTPRYVRVDRYAPAVSATNASDTTSYSSRTATVLASDTGSGLQAVRYSWNTALDAACATGTATSSGAVLTAPGGDNLLYLCARDNTGRVAQWSGRYRVSPMSVTGTVSPSRGSYAGTFTYTATATGGTPSTTQFAFFRRRPGGTWIPAVTAPNWQPGNTYPWRPALADVGTWETYIWVKDGDTPANANTYGYAAGVNTGLIEVVGPPTVPGATTVSCAWTSGDNCWVAGDFTASATASTGGMGTLVYEICRSNDSTGGVAGCDVNLTLTGGTSILVSGTHLPSDGFRRAYLFRAKDSAGAVSGWNTPRYVRVDRQAPTVSATNSSDTVWYSSRAATVAASDAGSGVQSVRYSWNTALDAACTTGTATSSGAAITAPSGDNLLYLCAKDNTGRVGQWSGRYRVSPLTLTGTVSPKPASHLETVTYTAAATGGTPATTLYAFFRRQGTGAWIPAVTEPNWQPANTFRWTPTLADVGTWETYIWVKDGDTPATMNTHGYAAGFNTGTIEIVGKPTVPGATTVSCNYTTADDCWVTGDFTATVTASTGGKGSLVYQICRSNDTAGFGGCDVNLTLTGGTSILVSGTHLPSDGFRRSYWFQAKDSAGALSGWNTPRYVRVDRAGPAVSATNASDSWFSSRTATVSASDAGSGLQGLRYSWNSALDAACLTGTATTSGTALPAPTGDNTLHLCARDNVGRVTQWSGRYRVAAPLTLTVTKSPAKSSYLTPITWTATPSGGVPGTIEYIFSRKRAADTVWISTPWQSANSHTWQPTLADVGLWDTHVVARDSLTPPDANGYGYAAWANPGQVEIVGPPARPGPTTVSCAYTNADDCWVTGDFTASVAASTGGMGSLVYQICRSNDSAGGFAGCDVNLTLTGGTSILVSGTHLPADGFRRAYYFQAKDSAGALSGWNVPRNVRVDRQAPAVGATNASDQWFASRTATVSASDSGSGLKEVRYSWNTVLDAGCTTGTVVAPGTELTVPDGDNLLYLCARDNAGRVAQWTGQYRVRSVPAPQVASVAPFVIHQGNVTVVTVAGANLQNANVYVATQPMDAEEPQVPSGGFPVAQLVGINAAGTALTVRIDATEAGLSGFFNLAVETPGGKTAGQFRVVGAEPVVDVLTPSQPVQGNIHVLMLAGVNLQGAEVVPSDPHVKVLDLDNGNDDSIMGLLYVDSNGPLGATEILIQRPSGESLSMTIEVVGSAAAASLETSQIDVPGRKIGSDVPDVLMQDPVISPYLLERSAIGGPGAPAGADGIGSATSPAIEICGFILAQQGVQRTHILLGLTDSLGKPITRDVLNRLAPGQRLNFSSTTVVLTASLEYQFIFKVCRNWVTVVAGCVRGQLKFMVPLVGGYSLRFDYCNGTEGPKVELAAEGFITKHEWNTSNQCMTVRDSDPTSESGQRSGWIDVNCCTPTDIHLHTTGAALDQTFDAQGKVASVKHENCTEPAPPELRLFLDVDGDNVVTTDADHLYEPAELDDSGRYLPCSPLAADGAAPGAGLLPAQLPQRVSVLAAYVQSFNGKLKIVPPPAGAASVEIELQNTSMLNGQATNYPADAGGGPGSTVQDPDFWLGVGDTTGQVVTASFGNPAAPANVAVANLFCNDYGGSTSLRARVGENPFTLPVSLPARSFSAGSRLPSAGWTAVTGAQVQPGSMQDTTDEDGTPVGAGQVGDGLSAFSEYRGVVINGQHYRLDPGKKDLFMMWHSSFPNLGGTAGLGLEIHRPRPAEVNEIDANRMWVNVHGMAIGVESEMVVAIALIEDDQTPLPPYDQNNPTPLGFTNGEVAMRGLAAVKSTLFTRRISEYRDRYPQRLPLLGTIDWVFSHEIGHAVSICHREEDQFGNAKPDPNCPANTLLDPKAVIPNGVYFMHSGTIFERIGLSTNALAGPAKSYHPNSLAQIKLK